MDESIFGLAAQVGMTPDLLLLAGIGLGSFILFVGVASLVNRTDPVVTRLRGASAAAARFPATNARGLLKARDDNLGGLAKAFVPETEKERAAVRRQLERAGIRMRNAVLYFYLFRTVIGLLLPLAAAFVVFFGDHLALPSGLSEAVAGLPRSHALLGVVAWIVAGFYGPALWLRWSVSRRETQLRLEFPNALDLLQIAVEAGLGFDAAMQRVAREVAPVSPEIAAEFAVVQSEILAGRDRAEALFDMGKRMGIEEATSFANVVVQSMRYGTSISDALLTYSSEMRQTREIRAQEKANRLPVQMSGVLAALMLPALLLITLTPVIIRWVRFFENM